MTALPGGGQGREQQEIEGALIPDEWSVFRCGAYKFDVRKWAEQKKAEAAKPKPKPGDDDGGDDDSDEDSGATTVVTMDVWLKPGLDRSPTTKQRKTLEQITRAPLWISRFGRALDRGGEERIELSAHAVDGARIRVWASRVEIATQARLLELATRSGLPVHQGNAKAVIEYLDACLYANGQVLPPLAVAQRTGLYEIGNERAWLLGSTWVTKPELLCEYDGPPIIGQHANAFSHGGDFDAWCAKLREIDALGPVARWATYSVFAAPLIQPLDWRTFFLHHHASSLVGKTAAAKFAMSAFGPPNDLLMTWDGSDVALAESFGSVSDAPVLFDELQMTTSKGERLSPIIYIMAGGSGRQRAGKSGGVLPKIMSWKSVIRTTGEQQIIGAFGVDMGGMASRTIQISRPILPDEGAAQRMYQWLSQGHYGHAAIHFLEFLRLALTDVDRGPWLRTAFQTVQSILRERGTPPKLCGHVAIVAVAQALARHVLLGAENLEEELQRAYDDGIVAVVNDPSNNNEENTLLFAALRALRDLRDENRRYWYDLRRTKRAEQLEAGVPDKIVGITTREGEIWINQTAANNALRHAQLTPSAVWDRLAGLGFLKRSKNGKGLTNVRRYNGGTNHVFVLHTDRFEPEPELNPVDDET